MFKTDTVRHVRQGDTCLQYTILPQTEDVLNNGGVRGKGRDCSPRLIHVRRSSHGPRRYIVKYILLILIGMFLAVIITSIPASVINSVLYGEPQDLPGERVAYTASSMSPPGSNITKSRKKELKISVDISSTNPPILDSRAASTSTIVPTNVPMTVTSERPTTPPWSMPALRPWKGLIALTTVKPVSTENIEQIPLVGTPSGSVRLLDHYMSRKPWEKDAIIRPTVTPEPLGLRNLLKYYSHSYTIHVPSEKSVTTVSNNNKVFDDVLITTKATTMKTSATTESEISNETKMRDLKDTILSVDDDEEFKESLEVDEVFSLPPLKPDPVNVASDSDEVTVSKSDGAWYGARWPFVDTSSYFQWTGYSPGDNLLLPLLMAALSSVCLVMLLALVVRRRKRACAASASSGLAADQQADDNTKLLTAENPEEAEE